jgi:non-ribosomal peptide synthetase component F
LSLLLNFISSNIIYSFLFFVNSIALQLKIESSQQISEFIQLVAKNVEEAQMHQDIPFEKLVEVLKVSRDSSKHPIYQVMFDMQENSTHKKNAHEQFVERDFQLEKDLYSIYSPAKFDLSLNIQENSGTIAGIFNYAISLFNKETVESMVAVYLEILEQFVKLFLSNNLANPITSLSYLPKNQRAFLATKIENKNASLSLAHLFEE